MKGAFGYFASSIVASLVYVVWLCWDVEHLQGGAASFGSIALFVTLFFFDGFLQALLLLILPWTAAVWLRRKFRWPDRLYFPAAGALLLFVIGCTAASISPKLLFIEDQTFLQGALIAAQRQGFVS